MAVILEVKSGPLAGKKIPVQAGQVATFGRTDKATYAFQGDERMSRLHFSVETDARGSRLVDRGSANGTFLNGNRVGEAPLTNGDEIRAGDTLFTVRFVKDDAAAVSSGSMMPPPAAIPTPAPTGKVPAAGTGDLTAKPAPPAPAAEAPSKTPLFTPAAPAAAAAAASAAPPAPKPAGPAPASVQIGSWVLGKIPAGWELQEGYGIQQIVKDAFPASVVATEEPLQTAVLQNYVEAQVNMLRQYLREPLIEPALPPVINGADETVAIEVRYQTKERQAVFYRRVYARFAGRVGVLTLTTLESDLPRMQPVFSEILAAASVEPKPLPS